MRALPTLAVASVALGGCTAILGIDDYDLADEDPSTVTGRSQITYIARDGSVTTVDEDLRGYRFHAYVPDPAAPTGFRIIEGAGRDDGTFAIPDVPPGPYHLKIHDSLLGRPVYFATSAREIDLGMALPGRPDRVTATQATPLSLTVSGMTPWTSDFQDRLLLASYSLGTQHEVAAGDDGTTNLPEVDATALSGVTVDWRTAGLFLLDARDDLHVFHSAEEEVRDAQGFPFGMWTLRDTFSTTGVGMTDGTPASVGSGEFARVPRDRTIAATLDIPSYEAAFEDDIRHVPLEIGVGLYAATSIPRGVLFGPPLFTLAVDPTGGRGGQPPGLRIPHLQQREFPVLNYGDPMPTAWARALHTSYLRFREVRLPGTSRGAVLFSRADAVVPVGDGVAQAALRLRPPTGLALDGRDIANGGAVAFDGTAPVTLSWQRVAQADTYSVRVRRVYRDDGQTQAEQVGVLRTTEGEIAIPAEVFSAGEFYAFEVIAHKTTAAHPDQVYRRQGFPSMSTSVQSGMVRLSAACGNGTVDAGEECDPKDDAAACDDDCTLPVCGDGTINTAAGEACDTSGRDTMGCVSGCRLPVCGDGVRNGYEECDDGNTTDEGNGCSATCTYNAVCGNGVVEAPAEQCDTGTPSDDAGCPRCQLARCGDGFVRVGEEACDDGNERDGDGCSSSCAFD